MEADFITYFVHYFKTGFYILLQSKLRRQRLILRADEVPVIAWFMPTCSPSVCPLT